MYGAPVADNRTVIPPLFPKDAIEKLLKNESGKLPLERKKIRKLAVIGQNAAKVHSDGGGSAEIKALYEICPLMGIKAYLGGNTEVIYAPG